MVRGALLSAFLGLLLVGANADDSETTCTPLVDAAESAGLTTLVAALQAANLVDAVTAEGATLTVFAPTDTAFEATLDSLGLTLEALVANTDLLTEILKYHVLGESKEAADLKDGDSLATLLGADSSCDVGNVTVSLADGVVIAGGASSAKVETADVKTCTAVVHVIDSVLLPCPFLEPVPAETAVTADQCTGLVSAATNANLTTLIAALEAANLVEAVTPGDASLTIFAPSNDAFARALETLGLTLDELVANVELLTDILKYHVVPGTFFAADLTDGASVDTLLGADSACGVGSVTVDLTEGVTVMGGETTASVVVADVETCSAVVHVIDFVLLPCPLPAEEGTDK